MLKYEDIFDAAEKGSVEDVKYFVEQEGVSVNAIRSDHTVLDYAFLGENVEVIKYLVSKGCNIEPPYLIIDAAGMKRGSVETLQLLIDKGCNVNYRDSGMFPLLIAAGTNNIDTAKFLLSKGADINMVSSVTGLTPLQLAKEKGNTEMVDLLDKFLTEQESKRLPMKIVKERERKEQEAHEKKEAEEAEIEKGSRKDLVEVNKKMLKKKWKIGVILHACTVAGYLYLLWGTNIIRNMWNSGSIIQAHLPLAILSIVLCVISAFFLRKSDYLSGFFFNIGMIFVQAITSCVWAGGVGILAWRLVFNIIRNTLTVIIPGFISGVIEGDEEKRREEKEAREKAEREKAEILRKQQEKEAEEREKAETLRKQQEEERKKAEEEKWQEDIRTGKVDFNKATVFFNNGNKLMDSGKNNEAIEQFTKAIEFNPRYNDAYCNRGVVYKKNGDLDKAIADYMAALRLNDDDAETYYNLGRAYMEQKDIDRAILYFTKSIASRSFYKLGNPQKAEIYINRGILKYNEAQTHNYHDYNHRGGVLKGLLDWIDAIKIDPNNSEATRLIQMANQNYNFESTLKEYLE